MMREHFGPGAETMRLISPRHALQHRRRHPRWRWRSARRAPATGTACTPSRSIRAQEFRAGRAGLSLWHRGRPQRPPLLRRGRRPGARDLGMVRARHPFQDAGPDRLRDPRQPPAGDRRTGSARSAPRCRRCAPIRSPGWPTDRRRCRQSRRDGRGLQRRLHRRSRAPSTPRAATGSRPTARLQPPKSNWARAISVPPFLAYPLVGAVAYTFGGLATDDARARAARRRADPRPLRGGRDHRAFPSHRTERRVGAARARVRTDRGQRGGCAAHRR